MEATNRGGVVEGLRRAPPRRTFRELDALEKITVRFCPTHLTFITQLTTTSVQYCNNVLLQEAIFQMLLWRTGQRTSLGLLSPEEERRLHAIGVKESEKSNWVHDVIRLRQAAEKRMLPSAKPKVEGKAKAKSGNASTRARTRRRA